MASSSINRWDPFREAFALQQRLSSLFEEANRGQNEMTTSGSFIPPVDIFETEHQLVLKLEIPGVKQEDLDIRVENNMMTIRGERRFATEAKEENYHRVERRYGSFARSFTLPQTVDAEKISAHYDAGVLTVDIAKKAEAKPKQIKVSVQAAQVGSGQGNGQRQVEGTMTGSNTGSGGNTGTGSTSTQAANVGVNNTMVGATR